MRLKGFTKLTCIDVGQSPLQFSVHISDTSVAAKSEIRNINDGLIYFRFIEEDSVHVILE